jgi:hypothetical protein
MASGSSWNARYGRTPSRRRRWSWAGSLLAELRRIELRSTRSRPGTRDRGPSPPHPMLRHSPAAPRGRVPAVRRWSGTCWKRGSRSVVGGETGSEPESACDGGAGLRWVCDSRAIERYIGKPLNAGQKHHLRVKPRRHLRRRLQSPQFPRDAVARNGVSQPARWNAVEVSTRYPI